MTCCGSDTFQNLSGVAKRPRHNYEGHKIKAEEQGAESKLGMSERGAQDTAAC